jgi:hypothetical protein
VSGNGDGPHLGVDVTNINSALVVEEHRVALALRIDTQIIFIALGGG